MSDSEQGTAVETQPVAPAEQGGEGTAPSQQQSGEAGNVETPQEGRQPERGIPPGAYRELKSLRQENREYQRRLAEIEQRLQQQQAPASNGQESPKSIWDDPDAYLESKFMTLQQRARLQSQTDEAYKFIQSQDDVRSVEDEDEIAGIMRENGLTVLLSHDPMKAIKLALKLWRDEKGINPNASKDLALTKNQAKAVVGAPAAGGKKVWTQAEIAQLSQDPVKWGEVRDDIVAAQKEGRIR